MKKKILTVWILSLLLAACGSKYGPGNLPHSDAPVSGIAFVTERNGKRDIYLIQPDGTGLSPLIASPEVDSDPAFSPDATMLAFRSRRDGSSEIYITAADGTGEWVNLVNDHPESFDDEFSPQWHPSGELLGIFTDRFLPPMGNCKAQLGVHHIGFIPLNKDKFTVEHFFGLAGEQETLAWSADGRILAFSSICRENNVRIHLWDRETEEIEIITDDSYGAANPAFSHDGRLLAFSATRDGPTDIYIYNLATGEMTNVTQSEYNDRHPSWSPDGSWIAFTRNIEGNDDIFIVSVESGEIKQLTFDRSRDLLPNWSPAP